MDLRDYFETTRGIGTLSTASADGKVNAALYARPHFLDRETVAFIMRDRLSHHNLQSNGHACYLFKEEGDNKGKRLYLTKTGEEKNSDRIQELRRSRREKKNTEEDIYLVYFHLEKVLPLTSQEE
jgi:hypothetical protein